MLYQILIQLSLQCSHTVIGRQEGVRTIENAGCCQMSQIGPNNSTVSVTAVRVSQ